jgi:hypothetical protein
MEVEVEACEVVEDGAGAGGLLRLRFRLHIDAGSAHFG